MIEGNLTKMAVQADSEAQYILRLSDHRVALNPLIGKHVAFKFNGVINCIHCGRVTKKSFSQGYCFPCSKKLAACDICIVKPERCHYEQGTCREPQWGLQNCFQAHYVYLANSSGIKVGITRHSQVPTRWLDQGAEQALPIYRVANRLISGLVEDALKAHVSDRTDWRKMLKGEAEPKDLMQIRDELYEKNINTEQLMLERFGDQAIERLTQENLVNFKYPVSEYPAKISSLGFDKTPEIAGELQGIKGQYLYIDGKVLNLRKHTGYHIAFDSQQ